MRAIEEVHGYKVMAQFNFHKGQVGREGAVILVDRSEVYKGKDRWVTAEIYEDDQSWNNGHYFENYVYAMEDFFIRSKQNAWIQGVVKTW